MQRLSLAPLRFGLYQEVKQPADPAKTNWASKELIAHYEEKVKPAADFLDKALVKKGLATGPETGIQMKIEWPFNLIRITPRQTDVGWALMDALKELGAQPRTDNPNNTCTFMDVLVDITSQETFDYVNAIERRLKELGKKPR